MAAPRAPQPRQFVKFTFYKLDPAWRRLPLGTQDQHRAELAEVIERFDPNVMVRTYSTLGTRGDCDFLLWAVSLRLESFQELNGAVLATAMGSYLTTPYSYLAMTKRSMYVDKHRHAGQEGRRLTVNPEGARYLFVYPFVKTRAWYLLSKDERQRMMDQHIHTGHKYPSVKLNTTYSFGLDDQEFVVAFETDSPADFLDLVMELRESEVSAYTLRDTPIFTCVAMPVRALLESLHPARAASAT